MWGKHVSLKVTGHVAVDLGDDRERRFCVCVQTRFKKLHEPFFVTFAKGLGRETPVVRGVFDRHPSYRLTVARPDLARRHRSRHGANGSAATPATATTRTLASAFDKRASITRSAFPSRPPWPHLGAFYETVWRCLKCRVG